MRIVVGMSGGVDSSVAALMLKRQGHDVVGVFMVNWEEQEDGLCPAVEDYEDVRRSCDIIGIPYYTVNFAKAYRERVFAQFLREYQAGRTPNPDVLCNKEIKFKAFLDFALKAEADLMATGHYARLHQTNDGVQLLKGLDANKDQSYFLCELDQGQLQKALFPLGDKDKGEVRALAAEAGLPNAQKKDSTGICFIGERNFNQFIAQYIQGQPGDMIDIDTGRIAGRHQGLAFHTIGQRKGLQLGGPGAAWFAVDKDAARNILYIAQGERHSALFAHGLETEGFHWIGQPPKLPYRAAVKIRYRQKDVPCLVTEGEKGLFLEFDSPQRAVTPGQYAVLYQGDICLGGGVIGKAHKEKG